MSDNPLQQTVEQYLFGPCSRGVLDEKALDSDYWDGVKDFIEEVENEKMSRLSFKQRDWLIKIKEGLLE
jgi:hypothetical protein